MTAVKPYYFSSQEKKKQVESMFNNIAPKYDFLNHSLSFGIDRIWRRRAIKKLKGKENLKILDIATGTCDFAIASSRLKPLKIVGVDLSSEMLRVGEKKINQRKLNNIISLKKGDSEQLPFNDNEFNAATVAFGVRNFENLNKGLSEIYRVLSKDSTFVVLEFSKPTIFPVKQLYNFYSYKILPWWGGFFSKDKAAYEYLPKSVAVFPEGKGFAKELERVGFSSIKISKQTFGIATIYVAHKTK